VGMPRVKYWGTRLFHPARVDAHGLGVTSAVDCPGVSVLIAAMSVCLSLLPAVPCSFFTLHRHRRVESVDDFALESL